MFPSPPPGLPGPATGPHSRQRRIGRTRRRFLAVHAMNPHFRQVHDLKAEFPQECICIQATAFLGDAGSYLLGFSVLYVIVELSQGNGKLNSRKPTIAPERISRKRTSTG